MDIVFYVSVLLFVLIGPWILVWRMNRGRKQNREEDQSRWRELTNRVLALELALKQLRDHAAKARPKRSASCRAACSSGASSAAGSPGPAWSESC